MILLDEPFTGVDPIAVGEVQDILLKLKNKGIGLLITDHNVREALSITNHSYIISEGTVVAKGTTQEILNNPIARQSYLGDNFPTSEHRLADFKDVHSKSQMTQTKSPSFAKIPRPGNRRYSAFLRTKLPANEKYGSALLSFPLTLWIKKNFYRRRFSGQNI